jgi:arylsulfatase A-like enzyme
MPNMRAIRAHHTGRRDCAQVRERPFFLQVDDVVGRILTALDNQGTAEETIAAGGVCNQTVCLADLLATCAEILGVTLPENAGEDSVSNLPLWRDSGLAAPLHEATVHHSIAGSFSIRRGRWKLDLCPGSGGWSHPRSGPACEGLPPIQLHDLAADILERHNLAADHPKEVSEITALLARYVRNGRSTPGTAHEQAGGTTWKQLGWMTSAWIAC